MILRMKQRGLIRTGHVEWPEGDSSGHGQQPVFLPRSAYRKLVVLIDGDLLDNMCAESTWTPELVLAGLLRLDHVTLLRYGDNGPPSNASLRDFGAWGKAVEGWAVLRDDEGDSLFSTVEYVEGNGVTSVVTSESLVDIARDDTASKCYVALASAIAAERRSADARAAAVAEAIGA